MISANKTSTETTISVTREKNKNSNGTSFDKKNKTKHATRELIMHHTSLKKESHPPQVNGTKTGICQT